MKRFAAILFLMSLCFICSAAEETEGDDICIVWNYLDRNAQFTSLNIRLFDSTQSISAVRYRVSRYSTCIANDVSQMADSTSALALRYDAIAGINASYFDMKQLTPVTYVKDNGVREGSTSPTEYNLRTDGLIRIKNERRILIDKCDTLSYDKRCERFQEAIAAGPVLLMGGKDARENWPDDSFYTGRHPRSIFGISANGWAYFIVIDGRAREAAGATIPETVDVARIFGLKDAINLDGGGSSTVWTSSHGTLNHPSDNKSFDHYGQRTVPNIIYICPQKEYSSQKDL